MPTLIEHLRLPARVYNALIGQGIDTVEQLLTVDPRSLKGIGRKSELEIARALKNLSPTLP